MRIFIPHLTAEDDLYCCCKKSNKNKNNKCNKLYKSPSPLSPPYVHTLFPTRQPPPNLICYSFPLCRIVLHNKTDILSTRRYKIMFFLFSSLLLIVSGGYSDRWLPPVWMSWGGEENKKIARGRREAVLSMEQYLNKHTSIRCKCRCNWWECGGSSSSECTYITSLCYDGEYMCCCC